MTPQRQLTYLRSLGLFFCVVGGALIAFGWHGSARRACVDCQVPYLISGGVGGLALVVFGAALLVVAQIRIENAMVVGRLDRLAEHTATSVVGGHVDASDLVLAGSSTYHRTDCRLVKTADLPARTAEMARAAGLAPCRVCWDGDTAADEPAAEKPAGAHRRG